MSTPRSLKKAHPGFPLKGEVWYVRIPNQPDDPHQPRPAIVVSRDVRNQVASDVMVVPVFGEPSGYNDSYVIIPEKEGGLIKESIAKCDQLSTINKALLGKGPLAGRVAPALMRQIHYAVRRALGETRVP